MREAELDPTDQLMIRHQFSQVQLTSNDWLRLAASILAGSTRAASVVTPARRGARASVTSSSSRWPTARRLLVLVLGDGNVTQQRLDRGALERELPDSTLDQAELDAAAAALNAELAGMTAPQVRRRGREAAAAGGTHRRGRRLDAGGRGLGRRRGGLHRRDRQRPRAARVRRGQQAAADPRGHPALELPGAAGPGADPRTAGVHVIIGRENTNDAMHEVSLVFAPYGAPDRALGLLGVLGPTRMRYPRAIPTVRYLSTLMNELINSEYDKTQ